MFVILILSNDHMNLIFFAQSQPNQYRNILWSLNVSLNLDSFSLRGTKMFEVGGATFTKMTETQSLVT